ncbi:hypothetical protein GDO81_008641 [Engystomops pustulosus]|uniref:Uncharacterized protein n=1 Tax=Engystomops pustulosus TaxID=76066 RepID=A0AAV7CHB5_ENGPU|nr:hypothetical protein GDO81_008641 [Engystomops pustulosus]
MLSTCAWDRKKLDNCSRRTTQFRQRFSIVFSCIIFNVDLAEELPCCLKTQVFSFITCWFHVLKKLNFFQI